MLSKQRMQTGHPPDCPTGDQPLIVSFCRRIDGLKIVQKQNLTNGPTRANTKKNIGGTE